MNWIKVTDRLPKIDTSDEWNKEQKISVECAVVVLDYGNSVGRYHYQERLWQVDGVDESSGFDEGADVAYWIELPAVPNPL